MKGTDIESENDTFRAHLTSRDVQPSPRRARSTWMIAAAGGLAVAVWTAPTRAQSDDAARAKAQFEQGQAAVQKGDLKRARALFLSSKDLFAAAGTLLNLADCEEKLGLPASAAQHYQDALALLPNGDGRVSFARNRLTAVEPRIPKLRIDVPSGAAGKMRVLLDGRELPSSRLGVDLPLDPGRYGVTVVAPGREDRDYSIRLAEAERQTVAVEAGPPEEAPSGDIARTGEPAAEGGSSVTAFRAAGFTAGGLGLLGVVFGGFVIAGALPAGGPLSGPDSTDLRNLQFVIMPAAIALTWTGIGLVTYSYRQPAAQVSVALGPGSASLSIGGSF